MKKPIGRKPNQLTPKQKRFVAEYLVDLNATQAYIRAGYCAKHADVAGPRLLGNVGVAKAIEEKQQKKLAKLEISAERLDQEAARLAFFDIRKLYRPDGTLIPINELDEDTARAIVGLDVSIVGSEEDGFSIIRKYKTASKEKGIELLYRRLGLLKDTPPTVAFNSNVLVIHTTEKDAENG